MGGEESMKGIKKFISQISKSVNLDRLYCLSVGLEAKKENSDVDLLIISSDFEGKKHFMMAAPFYLAWDSEYDIDIICLTPEDFKKKEKQIGTISEASQEGILIKWV